MDSRDLILRFIFDDFSLVAKKNDFLYEFKSKFKIIYEKFTLNKYPLKYKIFFVIKGRQYFPAPSIVVYE